MLLKQIVDEIESLKMIPMDSEHAEEFTKRGYKDTIQLLRALLPLISEKEMKPIERQSEVA